MSDVSRRDALKVVAVAATAAATGCTQSSAAEKEKPMNEVTLVADAVQSVSPLRFPWQTPDPFLFCVHHDDRYPSGNEQMGPNASLDGRDMGQDFGRKDGWSMYHGMSVPGFPQHPHRGFETVTIVRNGLLDHSDSLGAAARFGGGDVQWLTAGKGILHAEMFPLLDRSGPNPVELFQIWLNLPRVNKMVAPHFSMLWDGGIPKHVSKDAAGRLTEVRIIAGAIGDQRAPAPPPKSWAARADSDVAIWTIKMAANTKWTVPAASKGANRMLYFFRGSGLKVSGRAIPASQAISLKSDTPALLESGNEEAELLMLQGRPIAEPVVQHGPFVMTTREEIVQAFSDYQRTQFGGWPYPSNDPVHGREASRFARHADGKTEKPT